ncbi:hypothetical protein ORV05_02630 [Amycolatopsis cynarae]|uniref:ARB-07466-like C-terminal domain-containing protein n=1 Tax=Amycolatopsis cynarae TaxID=2995223 RepID=A0ABY7B348_9PSEU|nr:hypothetical protein [Amycolatopsis sp. HUAS 11-8]WAL66730.1 hypothetical protein ORV05_02630 [Amycolatopsis sp. HUAS 11-8]
MASSTAPIAQASPDPTAPAVAVVAPVAPVAPTTTTPKVVQACSTDLDGAQPNAAMVGNYLRKLFPVSQILGRGDRAEPGDHPAGLALDFMVNTSTGNALADFVLANRDRLGVKYVIWRQRYNDGSGWSAMPDRGSVTANHYDHVHVSFNAGTAVLVSC